MKKTIVILGVLIVILVPFLFINNNSKFTTSIQIKDSYSLNKKNVVYSSQLLFDGYGTVVHSFSDGKSIIYSTTTSIDNPFSRCIREFQSTQPEILEISEPGSDWLDFKEEKYGYSFKYPKDWKITHLQNYGKNTKVFSDVAGIIIQETDDYTEDYEANISICDQSSYYQIPIYGSDFGYIYRTKEAEQYEMSLVKQYFLCTILKNQYGCSEELGINKKKYFISYSMNNPGPFDQKSLKVLDTIISTFKSVDL